MPFDGAVMLRYVFITLFSTLALWFPGAGMTQELSLEKVEILSEGALPQIREFITRKLGCSHWEGKQSTAKLRTAGAKRAVRNLRCDELKEDEVFLRKVYAQHPGSIKALNGATGMQVSASGTQGSSSPLPRAGF
jgi:hypothetical protein